MKFLHMAIVALLVLLLSMTAMATPVVVEGDIIIADIDARGHGVSANLSWSKWPNKTVPYVIQANLPDKQRVLDAISHYHANTNLRFVPRTTQSGYIVFRPWTNNWCQSWIGYIGRAQEIELHPNCNKRSVIHEIGHAVGLWHEHTRGDRDKYVKVYPQNAVPGTGYNLQKQIYYSRPLGPYDYLSVMHYRSWELSASGKPVITKLDGSQEGLSNEVGLSAGDIAALRTIYP